MVDRTVSAADAADAVKLLAGRYPGTVAREALWRHAGGEGSRAPHADTPEASWREALRRACEGGVVTPMAMLRELLFDQPGHAEALRLVAAVTGGRLRHEADLLVEMSCDEAYPLDDSLLYAMLWSFPVTGVEDAFAALAVALDGRATVLRRQRVAESLAAIQGATEVSRDGRRLAASAAIIVQRLLRGLGDHEWTHCTVAIAATAAMLRRFADSADRDEAVIDELLRLAAELVPTTHAESAPRFAAHIGGARRVLERFLVAVLPGPMPPFDDTAAAFGSGLHATLGEVEKYDEDTDASPSVEAPPAATPPESPTKSN